MVYKVKQIVADFFVGALRKNKNSKSLPISLVDELGLDPIHPYFLLHASYGDKWFILSFLPVFFNYHPNVKIIALKSDRDLVRVFVGESDLEKYFIFRDSEAIETVSNKINPLSDESKQLWVELALLDQTMSVIENGFPKNSIRHLHIVKYPYFSDLILTHGISYGTLLKMLLYLPRKVLPQLPSHYSTQDYQQVEGLLNSVRDPSAKGFVLLNVVNISHLPLSCEQIELVVEAFERHGVQALINSSQHADLDALRAISAKFKLARIIEVPGHLFALITNNCMGVFGVIGGAMTIAVTFTNINCINLYSSAHGTRQRLKDYFGGRYGENIWKMHDEDWPCLLPGRIVDTIDIGNPEDFPNQSLGKIVDDFATKICNCVD